MPSTLDAELLQAALEGGHHGEHADGSGERRRAREDLIGGGRDVVAARGGVGAHRDHDGLARLAKRLHLAQDLFRREHAAAGAVHAQHHGLDRIVEAGLTQQVRGAFTADRAGRLMSVENLARCDDDAEPRIRLRFEHALGAHRRQVLAHADGVEGMVVGILPDQSFDLVGHLAPALECRHQAALQRKLRGVTAERRQSGGFLRDVLVEGIRRAATGPG